MPRPGKQRPERTCCAKAGCGGALVFVDVSSPADAAYAIGTAANQHNPYAVQGTAKHCSPTLQALARQTKA